MILGASTLCWWREGKSARFFDEIIHRKQYLWEIVDEGELAVSEDDALKLRSIAKDYQVVFSVHTPFLGKDIFSDNFILRNSNIESIKKSLQMANKYEAKFAIIHPGYRNQGISIEEMEEILSELFDLSRSLGITPLLENLTKSTTFYRPEDIKTFNRMLSKPDFVLDVGHANIENSLEAFLRINDNFSYFHLHDNSGSRDEHLSLGMGTINWDYVFSKIIKSDSKKPIVIENMSVDDLERSLIFILKILGS